MIADLIALIAAYGGPKALSAICAKFGFGGAAELLASVAPSVMSYTFFAVTTQHFPRFAAFCLLPQLGMSTLVFLSMGPNAYVLKNLVLPSFTAFAAYQGWFSASPFLPSFFLDSIRHSSMLIAIVLIVLHTIYVSRALAVRLVYPAPIIAQLINLKALRDNALQHGVTRHRIPSSATPGALLDALFHTTPEISVNGESSAAKFGSFPECWLIYLGGNGEVAEASIDSARMYGSALGCKVAVFNPRGVGESGGLPVSTSSELVTDAQDVIRFIIEKYGVRQEQIILFCHSIGGGVGGEIAAKTFPRINIVFDRTFSNLPDAARAMMPIFPQPLVKFALPKLFGEFNTDANFDLINHNRKIVSFHAHDQIIRYEFASLARLPQFGTGGKDEYRVVELTGRSADPHNSPTEVFRAGHMILCKKMAEMLAESQQAKN